MMGDQDRFASGDPPVPALFAPAPAVPVVPAIPVHMAAAAAAVVAPFGSTYCPVCVLSRPVTTALLLAIGGAVSKIAGRSESTDLYGKCGPFHCGGPG